jgi:glycosyltransferase involved in cell wall biosynthesis
VGREQIDILKKNIQIHRKNIEILECNIVPFSFHDFFLFPHDLLKKINSCDCYYSPYCNIPNGIRIPVFITIHDMVFPDMPELTSVPGLAARMWVYRRAIKKSKKIFTVSNFSASRIRFHTKTQKPIVITHSAIQRYLTQSVAPYQPNLKDSYILFVGNIKKHKGLSILLDAFFVAKSEGLAVRLVIAGEKNNFRSADNESLTKLLNTDSSIIEFTGFVSDDKLRSLYAGAALLVQPSLYEGFCLPPLEAMVQGTPVLISDIPVLKEVYDNFPVYFFRSGDSEDLKDKLLDFFKNKVFERIHLTESQRDCYTFKKTSDIILLTLEEG